MKDIKSIYWGAGPLPRGAEIVGEYQHGTRRGALIRLANGIHVQGNAGTIRAVNTRAVVCKEGGI